MSPINLVAHRGYQRRFPENTLLAYVEAVKGGIRFIETDVQLSADKQPVLYHDRTLERCSGAKGAIHDYPFAQLVRTPNHEPLRFGKRFISQTITPLKELVDLLQTHSHVHAFIEAKSISIDFHGIETCFQCIQEVLAPVAGQCTLISFHIPFIHHARTAGWHSLGVAPRKWQDLHREEVKALHPEYLFVDYDSLPEQGRLDQFPGTMVIYEVDCPEIAKDLQQRGIEYIESFAAVELQEALEQESRYQPMEQN
ncbi:MAG: glycerophosphodiester phosphodiesterase family protein [Pseudomonadales bacterium]|jgi:glycerophosphoryl diester phosphodiesterase